MASVEKNMMGGRGKVLSGIGSAYVRVKGCERERFRIDSRVRYVCIMFPWLFNVHMGEGG